MHRSPSPLRVAWLCSFPVEQIPECPEVLLKDGRRVTSSWLLTLRDALSEAPLELHIFSFRNNLSEPVVFTSGNATFYILPSRGGTRAPSLFATSYFSLRPWIERVRPHVVHGWGTENGAQVIAPLFDRPTLLSMQGLMTWYVCETRFKPYHLFIALLEALFSSAPVHITTESTFSVRWMRSIAPTAAVQQVEHAPHPSFFDIVLEAFHRIAQQVPAATLICAGRPPEGDIATQLEKLPATTRERIQFEGVLERHEVQRYHANVSALLLPTRADTSPNAVKEAAVVGLPVIATRVGGITDYIHHGLNGHLIDSFTPDALAQAMAQLHAHPVLGQGGTDADTLVRVRHELSTHKMADSMHTLYKSLANTTPAL